jgi:hypothetical protein
MSDREPNEGKRPLWEEAALHALKALIAQYAVIVLVVRRLCQAELPAQKLPAAAAQR